MHPNKVKEIVTLLEQAKTTTNKNNNNTDRQHQHQRQRQHQRQHQRQTLLFSATIGGLVDDLCRCVVAHDAVTAL